MQPSADSGNWFESGSDSAGDAGFSSYSAQPASPPARKRIAVGDILTVVGAGFILLFSITPFVSYPEAAREEVRQATKEDFSGWYTAWSGQTFMAPLTLFVVLAGVLLLVLVGVRLWKDRDLTLLGFQLTQLQVGVALFAFLVLIGYALSNKQVTFGMSTDLKGSSVFDALYPPSFAWGGMFMLFGSALAVAGVVLTHLKVGENVTLSLPAVSVPGLSRKASS